MQPQPGFKKTKDPVVQVERISEADMLIFEADQLADELLKLTAEGASQEVLLPIQREIAAAELAVDKVKDWLLTSEQVPAAPWAREKMAAAKTAFEKTLAGTKVQYISYDRWADACISQLSRPPPYCRKSWLRTQEGRQYVRGMDDEVRASYRRHMQEIAVLGIRDFSEERTSTNLILLCHRLPDELIPVELQVNMRETERLCTTLYSRWPLP